MVWEVQQTLDALGLWGILLFLALALETKFLAKVTVPDEDEDLMESRDGGQHRYPTQHGQIATLTSICIVAITFVISSESTTEVAQESITVFAVSVSLFVFAYGFGSLVPYEWQMYDIQRNIVSYGFFFLALGFSRFISISTTPLIESLVRNSIGMAVLLRYFGNRVIGEEYLKEYERDESELREWFTDLPDYLAIPWFVVLLAVLYVLSNHFTDISGVWRYTFPLCGAFVLFLYTENEVVKRINKFLRNY